MLTTKLDPEGSLAGLWSEEALAQTDKRSENTVTGDLNLHSPAVPNLTKQKQRVEDITLHITSL